MTGTIIKQPQAVYSLGIIGGDTLDNLSREFANLHNGETCYNGLFSLTPGSIPSDIPANEVEWRYAFGEIRVRTGTDRIIILYGFNTNKMAIKSPGGTWKII